MKYEFSESFKQLLADNNLVCTETSDPSSKTISYSISNFKGKFAPYTISIVCNPDIFDYGTGNDGKVLFNVSTMKNGRVSFSTPVLDKFITFSEKSIENLIKEAIDYSKENTLDNIIEEATTPFLDNLNKEIAKDDLTLTDNGAIVYNTSGHPFVDFDFGTSTFRNRTSESIYDSFKTIFLQNKELAMRHLFFLGDIREGKGERHAFKSIIQGLALDEPKFCKAVLKLIPEYSRWDVLSDLVLTSVRDEVISIIKEQLAKDVIAIQKGESASLCAKWLPSINAKSLETRKKALIISEALGMDKKQYRQTLALVREKLNVIEQTLSTKNYKKLIEMQSSFTSKQNLQYRKALEKNIPMRKEFLESAARGEVNFNVSVLEPHEIVYKYKDAAKDDLTFETMWKLLPNKVVEDNNVLVVRDGSGSMTIGIPGTNKGSVLDVATAMSIYFAEHSQGQFKDKFITFSENPRIVNLSGASSLREKMAICNRETEIANTNIERTFDLILKTACKNNMEQKDLPANLLIISDMQFDMAVDKPYDEPLFESIKAKFEANGYKVPRLIFWNVNVQRSTIPVIDNDLGLVFLSGFSKNIVEMIAENNFEKTVENEKGEEERVLLTPFEILCNKLLSERYNPVSEAIKDLVPHRNIVNNKDVAEDR